MQEPSMSTEFSGRPGLQPDAAAPWMEAPDAYEESAWDEEYAHEDTGALAPLRVDDRQLTQALGWFSIGLGLVELLAPRALGRAIGVGDHPALIRALGVREIVSGVGLLSERAPATWAWSRAAGDAMDLALLGAALRLPEAQPQRIGAAAGIVLGAAAIDFYAGQRLSSERMEPLEISVSEVVAINETPQALYAFWSNLENLPMFMSHLKSVAKTSERMSHWVAKGPIGTTIEWDSEVVDDQQDVRIGWRTLPDSEIRHEGIVTFEPAPGGRGSIVRVEMIYWPPAGKVGVQLARLLGEEPSVQINRDLRKLKQLIETGEVATTLGQPSGKRSLIGRATLGGRLQ
jgi:uncharacterized membrane protein